MFFMKPFGDKLKFAPRAAYRLCDDYIIYEMSIFDLLNEKMQPQVEFIYLGRIYIFYISRNKVVNEKNI